MAKNADLHTHSHHSDGQISPKELVKLAKKRGLKNLALTDHDSVNGINEAVKEGKRIGLKVIPAIEVRCDHSEILGYFIDSKNKKLNKIIGRQTKSVLEKIKEMCRELDKNGFNINFDEIIRRFPRSKNNINEFYIYYMLHLKGYGKMREVAKKIKRRKIKNKKVRYLTTIQAIKLVKQANGVPVLAHPWLDRETLKEKTFKKYVEAGLKGIEIRNGDVAPLMKKSDIKKMRKFAEKYNLVLTSGSDFHGIGISKQMPGNHELGANNCGEKVVERLRALAGK